ncbi:hypothetical protein, partial [Schnuerera sp.]|uniref:hypothetical protein n=1 Tax=Schnuerera sp. TaxID=2794844 RepID=UPI002C2CCA21
FDVPIYIENIRGADEIWDYDELNAVYLSWFDIKVDKILPFKYTKNLKRIENKRDPEIDVLVYGYMNDIRLNKLKDIYPSLYHNYSIVTTTGLNKEIQDQYIANSKIILNLHGIEPYSRQEQERIAFLLINEKCVLSETNQINYFGDLIVDTPLNNISNKIKELLLRDAWKEVARNGHRFYKDKSYSTYKKVEI